MFISVVLNLEYMDIDSRSKWYLKNLLHCKENGWILITHEYLKNNFEQIQEEITEKLFNDFEMKPFSKEDVADVEQYFIPDNIFHELDNQSVSRTQVLETFTKDGIPALENYIDTIIENIKAKHPDENIQGVFNCLETPMFLKRVCEKHNLKIIPYVFSAIRKSNNYRQTLYYCNIGGQLYCSDDCEIRYKNFLNKNQDIDLPIFNNKELIAIFGKTRTLPLLKIMDNDPDYEIGICGECFRLLPHTFTFSHYTDDDIHYECDKIFDKGQKHSRQHPLFMNQIGFDRSEIRNDPAAFILSCRRITAVASQIILKAMLWNRTPVMKRNTLPFSFACSKSYDSQEKVDIVFLNFFIFSYLIPSQLMFDKEYWKWRMTSPTEREIYLRHIEFYKDNLGLDDELLYMPSSDYRLYKLLDIRDCDKFVLNQIMSKEKITDIDYNAANSRFEIIQNDGIYNVWTLNSAKSGKIESHYKLESTDNLKEIVFYPLDDVAGLVKITDAYLVSENRACNRMDVPQDIHYYKKYSGIRLDTAKLDISGSIDIVIEWQYFESKQYIENI